MFGMYSLNFGCVKGWGRFHEDKAFSEGMTGGWLGRLEERTCQQTTYVKYEKIKFHF